MSLFSHRVWTCRVSVAFGVVCMAAPAGAQCGGTWVPDALPSLNNMNVKALAVLPSQTGLGVVVGGQSSAPDLVRVLNGDAWEPLGGGVMPNAGGSGQASAIAALPDGSIAVGGRTLYAGGFSNQALLRWNGSSWSLMGGGVGTSYVTSLLVEPDGSVLAGGNLSPGGTGIYGVARWNPSTDQWTGIAGGPAGSIYALARRPNGNIIAAGDTSVGEWNGASWTILGGATASVGVAQVLAVAVLPNGDVVAGGNFRMFGGVEVYNVARWNGLNWSYMPVIPGVVIPEVRSMVVAGNGNLIAGGTGGIVRWDGSTWTRLSPPNSAGQVYALAAVGSSGIVAGGSGYFPRINGVPQQNIGRYAPPTADFNQDGDVGTDADIEAFFACLGGDCCSLCGSMDFNGDGDVGTDGDIEAFFRVLGEGNC